MGKHKTEGKDKKKGSQLVLRLDKAERDAFVSLCERLDTSAAREIRRFMREFVSANSASDLGVVVALEPTVIEPPVIEGVPAVDATIAPDVDAPVEVAVDEAERPKNKPRRTRLEAPPIKPHPVP